MWLLNVPGFKEHLALKPSFRRLEETNELLDASLAHPSFREAVSQTARDLGLKIDLTQEMLDTLSEKLRKPLHDALNTYDSSRHGPFPEAFLNRTLNPPLKDALLRLKHDLEQDATSYLDDDRELVLKAKTDSAAFDELRARMRHLLTSAVSKRTWPRTFSKRDKQQEADAGLWLAVTDFDPAKGRFRAFAETVVGRYLADALTRPRTRKRNKS